MEVSPVFIGIDVSKAQLDIFVRPLASRESVGNEAAGIKTLVERARKLKPALIVLRPPVEWNVR